MSKNIIFKILIGVLIILIVLGVIDFFTNDNLWITDYIRGSFTETIGIVITLIFVERIISAQQRKDEKEEEVKQIKRLDKILSLELQKILDYAGYMALKGNEQQYKVTKNFQFNRLANFFIPALNVFEAPERAFKVFFQSIDVNLITIREALMNYDFKYFPNMEKLLLEYIDFMGNGTPFNFLSSLEHNKGFPESIKKMIEEIPDDKTPTYEEYRPNIYEGKPANIMTSIIRLYEIINFHIDFSERYSNEISNICEK